MRILHITNHVLEIGNGIVNVAVDLACAQSDYNHEVFFASGGGEYEDLLNDHGVKHCQMVFSKSLAALPRMLYNLHKIIKITQPDIVHAHMMTGALIAKILRFRGNYKLVTHIHNEFQRSARLMGIGNAVIAVSEAVADSMQLRGIPSRKLHVIRNGVIGSPRVSAVVPIKLEYPAIITVAGLYERKGIRDLILAFDRLPESIHAHLYIIGEGPDRVIFENLAMQSNRVSKIHFEGFKRQPQAYLREATIFVLASRKDPFPLVLLEAREYGCPIIASNTDGIPEALEHGVAGYLVPVRDAVALSDRIQFLLEHKLSRENLGRRARENMEQYTVKRMVDQVINLYNNILITR